MAKHRAKGDEDGSEAGKVEVMMGKVDDGEALGNIERDGQVNEIFASSAKDVSGTGISIPVISYVLTEKTAPDDIGEGYGAQEERQ